MLLTSGVRTSDRYRSALAAYNRNRRNIHVVVGHSLGGAVAEALSEDYGVGARTYNAPHFGIVPRHVDARRTFFDPVSYASNAKRSRSSNWNPHTYHGMRDADIVHPILDMIDP